MVIPAGHHHAMTNASLKLADNLNRMAVSNEQAVTPNAHMVDAIRMEPTAAERRAQFVAVAVAARAEALQSGEGFVAEEVHAYLRARAQGHALARPTAKFWRGRSTPRNCCPIWSS